MNDHKNWTITKNSVYPPAICPSVNDWLVAEHSFEDPPYPYQPREGIALSIEFSQKKKFFRGQDTISKRGEK